MFPTPTPPPASAHACCDVNPVPVHCPSAPAGDRRRSSEAKGESWVPIHRQLTEHTGGNRKLTQYTDIMKATQFSAKEKRRTTDAAHNERAARSRLDPSCCLSVKSGKGSKSSRLRSSKRRQKEMWEGMAVGRTKTKTDAGPHPSRDAPSLREWGEVSRYVSCNCAQNGHFSCRVELGRYKAYRHRLLFF